MRYVRILQVIITTYIIIYAGIISFASGIPYVMDNNETYSSITHVKSINEFGLEKTKGLADEVFSPNINASPYVHSHQGNFPRLYALFIDKLGANDPELQIIVTTFTIGLGTILLIFYFFSKIHNKYFAFIVCLLLTTDYILFSQWQIVTYRVWYGFFIFSSLSIIEKINESNKQYWYFLISLVSVALLYFELIFAAYVLLIVWSWALYRFRFQIKKFIMLNVFIISGGALGIAIFFNQVISYLGFSDFLKDIEITFIARNSGQNLNKILTDKNAFYIDKKVIFWNNIFDTSNIRNIHSLILSISKFVYQVYTPLFTSVIMVIFISILISLFTDRKYFNNSVKDNIILNKLKYLISSILFFLILINIDKFDGNVTKNINLFYAVLGFIFFCIYYYYVLKEVNQDKIIIYLLIINFLLVSWPYFFDNKYYILWKYLVQNYIPLLATVPAIITGMIIIKYSNESLEFKNSLKNLKLVMIFLFITATCYSIIYFISPGYIFTGYLVRFAPFVIFFTILVVSMSLYIVFELMIIANKNQIPSSYNIIVSYFPILTILTLIVIWATVQINYLVLLPPNHYSFLKLLNKQPYRNASFVVNNYPAPIFAFTNNWAYYDPGISSGVNVLNDKSYGIKRDISYLWFADKEINSDYRLPNYYLCVIPQTLDTALSKISQNNKNINSGCGNIQLIKDSLNPTYINKGLSLVARDDDGINKYGFDSWAIVKFDWDKGLGSLKDN